MYTYTNTHTHTHRCKTRKTKEIFNYISTTSTVAIYVIYVCKQCVKHTKTIYHLNGGAINISCDDNTLHFTKSTGTVQSYISSEINVQQKIKFESTEPKTNKRTNQPTNQKPKTISSFLYILYYCVFAEEHETRSKATKCDRCARTSTIDTTISCIDQHNRYT